MATTITKEMFAEQAPLRYEEVEIEGWGTIGIRSISKLRASQRASRLFSLETGELLQEQADLREIHRMIDQLMVDKDTPMFTEADTDLLKNLDDSKLEPVLRAIRDFNGAEEVPVKNELSDGSES